jgi:magnesium-transporting ATPase (P-type)
MFKEHNLVRRLHASETMGGAHEICSDKTGTLTQNRMTVMALYVSGQSTHGSVNAGLNSDKNSGILAESVIYNCSAHVELEKGVKTAKGNVTEVGMLKYLMESNIEIDTLFTNRGHDDFYEFQIPFNSSRKRQTSAVRLSNGKVRVFVKGGPEIVIEQCGWTLDAEGKKIFLTSETKNDLMNVSVVKAYASKCYRTLLVAYCDYEDSEWNSLKSQYNNFEKEAD